MAVLVIGDLQGQGADAATDTRLMQEMNAQNSPPPGAIARFAGATESGYRVITVWESEDDFQTFRRELLMPTFQRLGMSPPAIQVLKLDDYRIVAPTAPAQASR